MNATVYRVIGGHKLVSAAELWARGTSALFSGLPRKKLTGIGYNRLVAMVQPLDQQIREAHMLEKSGDIEVAIVAYEQVISAVRQLTEEHPHASAHRNEPAPVDRLSLLLERKKKFEDALKVIHSFRMTFDPVQPGAGGF